MVEPTTTLRKHLPTLLKLIFVVGLMWFVLSNIQWRDSYEIRRAGVEPQQVQGRIVGAWDLPEVRFTLAGDEPDTFVLLRSGKQPDGSEIRILPGLWTYWHNLYVLLFLLGALCYLIAAMFAITRWWWLLKKNDLPVSYWDATRFAWIGIFFNNIVPGQTGGDLIKAVYVMKRCHGNRVAALVSVIVDRVMGLGSLSLLAAIAVLFYLDEPDFRVLAVAIWGVLGAVALLGVIAFSRRIRNTVRLPWLLRKLPRGFGHLLERLDQAVFFYRSHKGGMFLWLLGGMGSHVVNVLCVYFIGNALGMGVPVQDYFVLIPVILIVSAIPIAPNGWGVGEAMFGYLFQRFTAAAATAQTMYTRGVSLSLLYRIHLTLWSLLGGLILLFTKDRVTRQDVEHEVALEEVEEMADASEIGGDGEATSR
ncbi:MAG: lysylphosphatidylglycerol synthase transmembrane domain-containing protein [Planctomycetota bacterium]|jgi:uncharacterized protein (TIRG00374 family)